LYKRKLEGAVQRRLLPYSRQSGTTSNVKEILRMLDPNVACCSDPPLIVCSHDHLEYHPSPLSPIPLFIQLTISTIALTPTLPPNYCPAPPVPPLTPTWKNCTPICRSEACSYSSSLTALIALSSCLGSSLVMQMISGIIARLRQYAHRFVEVYGDAHRLG